MASSRERAPLISSLTEYGEVSSRNSSAAGEGCRIAVAIRARQNPGSCRGWPRVVRSVCPKAHRAHLHLQRNATGVGERRPQSGGRDVE